MGRAAQYGYGGKPMMKVEKLKLMFGTKNKLVIKC